MTNPFGMIEMAVKELVEERYEPARDHVGGDLAYEGELLYVWLGLVPGGAADQLEGSWIVDIDCFAPSYANAMQAALDIEAALLGRRYADTSEMRLDRITQNEGPAERPWDDESVFRIGATYAFTARRSG